MKLKSVIGIAVLAIGFSSTLFAQRGDGKHRSETPEMKAKKEQLMEERKAFINEKVGFTEKEATEFWKIESEKMQALKAVKTEMPKGAFKLSKEDIDKLSDKEAEQKAVIKFDMQRKKIDIDEKFSKAQIKAVGAKKFLLSENADKEFRHSIMKKMKGDGNRPGSKPVHPPMPPAPQDK